jgi:hypothetical protein
MAEDHVRIAQVRVDVGGGIELADSRFGEGPDCALEEGAVVTRDFGKVRDLGEISSAACR